MFCAGLTWSKAVKITTDDTQRGVYKSGSHISLIHQLPCECEAKRDALPNHIHQPEGSAPCFASNSNISLPGTSPVLRNHNPVEGENCLKEPQLLTMQAEA